MDFFTLEHLKARETYNTTDQANHWLNTINTTCLNKELSLYLNENATNFIERMPYFFFATSSSNGNTNVNFKGADGNKLIKEPLANSNLHKHLVFPHSDF